MDAGRDPTIANVSSIAAEPDLQATWPDPATLVELGAPITVGLPLGFGSNPTGAGAESPRGAPRSAG